MDLLSFVPGVAHTALFSPGAATPSPYNVNHTGGTDGTSPDTATNNMAEIYNRLLLQIASCIDSSGIGLDNTNWAQLGPAVRAHAQQIVNAALAGGVVTTSNYNADFAFSHGQTGWQRLKNGLILQWGQTQSPNTFPAFFNTTFPVAFPSTVYQVFGTVENKYNTGTYNIIENDIKLSSKTTTGATWFNTWTGDANGGSAPTSYFTPLVYWYAIGK